MKKPICYMLILVIFCHACKEEVRPKPKAFLALNYPQASYKRIQLDCPYSFEKNSLAEISPSRNRIPCWIDLDYKLLDGSVFITYQRVQNNLDSLLRDAQKLPLEHTIKADAIEGDLYTNKAHKTYGMFYEIDGNAASQANFYVTDSVKHFLTGSLYFNRVPNFDSLVPAAAYIKKDMRKIMESIKWKN